LRSATLLIFVRKRLENNAIRNRETQERTDCSRREQYWISAGVYHAL
jgi:hypothetical protein